MSFPFELFSFDHLFSNITQIGIITFTNFVENNAMNSTSDFTCLVRCSLINDLFSQEYAAKKHSGMESEDNVRYQWEDEFMVHKVVRIEIIESGTYFLKGTYSQQGEFSYPIASMQLIHMHHFNGEYTPLAFSKQLIKSIVKEEYEGQCCLLVELNDHEPFINPISGVYIANSDIPQELKNA